MNHPHREGVKERVYAEKTRGLHWPNYTVNGHSADRGVEATVMAGHPVPVRITRERVPLYRGMLAHWRSHGRPGNQAS
jgi:hypothetical protein